MEASNREGWGTRAGFILAAVGWHPYRGLRVQLGIGRKDPSGHHENAARVGVGYEFELGHRYFVKPYFAVDFIEHEENEQVLGAYVGLGF